MNLHFIYVHYISELKRSYGTELPEGVAEPGISLFYHEPQLKQKMRSQELRLFVPIST